MLNRLLTFNATKILIKSGAIFVALYFSSIFVFRLATSTEAEFIDTPELI